jgi:hypothetical protein
MDRAPGFLLLVVATCQFPGLQVSFAPQSFQAAYC